MGQIKETSMAKGQTSTLLKLAIPHFNKKIKQEFSAYIKKQAFN